MNRQVPNLKYTIIGDGKVAQHIQQYFDLVGVEYNCWNRKQSQLALHKSIANADFVLLLISDRAIKPFIENNSLLQNKSLIHFSGSLQLNNVAGCHPLMTFANEAYDLDTYKSIPFICDEGVDFITLFPQLDNKSFNISNDNKAYYHSLCVIAGNFSQILMQETSKQLANNLDLPKEVLFPYLQQNTKNYINNPGTSATGPIQRRDIETINNHIKALDNNPLLDIYNSFIKLSNHSDFPNYNSSSIDGSIHSKLLNNQFHENDKKPTKELSQ